MESSDREILLDIKAELALQRKEHAEFRAVVLERLDKLERDVLITQHDMTTLTTFIYWILGAIGIFLAAMSIPSIIASGIKSFREAFNTNHSEHESDDALIERIIERMNQTRSI